MTQLSHAPTDYRHTRLSTNVHRPYWLGAFAKSGAAIAQPLGNLVLGALSQEVRNAPGSLRPTKIVADRCGNVILRLRVFFEKVPRPFKKIGKPLKRRR